MTRPTHNLTLDCLDNQSCDKKLNASLPMNMKELISFQDKSNNTEISASKGN